MEKGETSLNDINKPRCQYRYYDSTNPSSQLYDNQCILSEDHIGEHIKKEIFPPPQPLVRQKGWIKS